MWAASWFFFVLLSYSMVRPIRETMGAIGGTKQLQGLMLATFVAMLAAVPAYGWLVSRLPRRWLVRVVFHFFCVSLVLFSVALAAGNETVRVWSARTFFVWVNVFALFATSVFWSVLADLFGSEQGKRLFGRIAAGGTIGAITGSFLTSQIATVLSTSWLLLIPIVTLQLGLVCAWRLDRSVRQFRETGDTSSDVDQANNPAREKSPSVWAGVTQIFGSPYLACICLFLVLGQAAGTQLYFQQAEIVKSSVPDDQAKTQLFAYIDFATQLLTLLTQVFVSKWVLRRLGVGIALLILPVVYGLSFTVLSFHGQLMVVAVAMVATRSMGYGITVPAREVLFTVVTRDQKYKSKSFIDTVVLRGGDAFSSQVFGYLRNVTQVAFPMLNIGILPIVVAWGWIAIRLGRRQQTQAALRDAEATD